MLSSAQFSSVHFSHSVVSNSLHDPMNEACQASLSITSSWNLLRFIPIVSVMPSSHLIFCHPLLLQAPIPPSISIFSIESTLLMSGAEVLEFQLQRQSFQWKLVSFRIDCWIPLQSKVLSRVFSNTIFQKHPFCAAQLSSQSNPHIHTWPLGKAIALTRRTFLGKVTSLVLNILSRLVRTVLPRSKRLLISWLQSPSAVMLEPPKRRDDRKAQSSDWTRKK